MVDVDQIHLSAKAVGEEMGENFFIVAVEQEAAFGIKRGPSGP